MGLKLFTALGRYLIRDRESPRLGVPRCSAYWAAALLQDFRESFAQRHFPSEERAASALRRPLEARGAFRPRDSDLSNMYTPPSSRKFSLGE